ncbi:MAG: class I SAM-dependent methyltransferase [Acidobacteriota bacterium]
MSSILRSAWVRTTLASIFETVQERLGVSVTPSHFYFPVPKLRAFRDKDWSARRPCAAVDLHLDEQVDRLHSELAPFSREQKFSEHNGDGRREFHFNNGYFERVDAEVAYAFVRRRKARRVIEVGSGNSTLVLAAALRANAAEGYPGELTSIEPHPAPYLREGIAGLTKLLEMPVQQVPVQLFRQLQAGDILFIDSSHVVSMDSDVLYECLRILPELAAGVLVHFHDIFTPLDYPEKFVKKNLCFWGEQYLLEAFLAFNSAYRVVWSSSAMQAFHPEILRAAFPAWEGSYERMPADLKVFAPTLDGRNVWPCSFWIERQAA